MHKLKAKQMGSTFCPFYFIFYCVFDLVEETEALA